MDWNLEGKRVVGMYMGSIAVSGVVDVSRVKYGGTVSHHIQLDNEVMVYGAIRGRVILDAAEVIKVL